MNWWSCDANFSRQTAYPKQNSVNIAVDNTEQNIKDRYLGKKFLNNKLPENQS